MIVCNSHKLHQYFFIKLLIIFFLFPILGTASGVQKNTLRSLVSDNFSPLDFFQSAQIDNNVQAKLLLLQIDSLGFNQEAKADSLLHLVYDMAKNMEITDTTLLGDIYHRQGKYLSDNQMYREALNVFNKSLRAKRSLANPDSASIARSENYKGIAYWRLNNLDSALLCYNQARRTLDDNEMYNRDLHDIYINTGIIHAMLGNFDKAYSFFQKSYAILQDTTTSQDSLMVAIFHSNYGLLATYVGKTKEANLHYDISEKYYTKLWGDQHPTIAMLNLNKGMNAYYNYDFAKATLFTSKALDVFLKNKDYEDGVPRTLYNLGSVSLLTGNYRDALEYSQRGLSYAPDNDMRLLLTLNMASSLHHLNQTQKADAKYREALTQLNQENISKTRAAKVYEQYAKFLLSSQQTDSGYIYLKKALAESQKLYGTASDMNGPLISTMGDYFLNYKNNPDSALYWYRSALALWQNNDSIQLANYNKTLLAQALIGEAMSLNRLASQSGDINYLFESEKAFTNVLNQMRKLSLALSSENKLVLSNMLKPVWQQAIRAEYLLYEQTNDSEHLSHAFEFAENAKSTALLASVNNQYALKTADLPDEVFNFENQLKTEMATIQRILAGEKEKKSPDKRKIPFYESRLLALMNQHDRLIIDIEKNYKKYFEMKYGSKVKSAAQIMNNLHDNELFIEYEFSDSVLYRITLNNSQINLDQITINQKDLQALTRLISIKNTHVELENFQSFNQFRDDALLGYQLLLGNLDLENNNNRLTIVPDGILGYLPFEILLESESVSDSINYRDLPYVFKHHAIAYTPSATLKYNPFFNQSSGSTNNRLLAFAPSYPQYTDTVEGETRSANLKNLPFARKEAIDIGKQMDGDVFTTDMATKENFIAVSEDYGLLHLAMHTLINDTLPMMSKLVFFPSANDSTSPYLNIYEIYGLNLHAKQVTLSACNTGTGKFSRGEGIMSLARGFIFAGVPSIVMTLWEVQDESGAEIMKQYYSLLNEGLPKDKALQQAKINVLMNANMVKSHPYYWSSYVLSGDTTPIVPKHQLPWEWLMVIIFGVALLLYRRKKGDRVNSEQ